MASKFSMIVKNVMLIAEITEGEVAVPYINTRIYFTNKI